MIATQDIAAFAARALAARDWNGFQVRELLGQRDLSFDECHAHHRREDRQARTWPTCSSRTPTNAAALQQAGMSKSVADTYAEMDKAFDDGIVKSVEGRN